MPCMFRGKCKTLSPYLFSNIFLFSFRVLGSFHFSQALFQVNREPRQEKSWLTRHGWGEHMCSGCGNVRELGRIQGFPDENPIAPGTNESFFTLRAKDVRPVTDNLGNQNRTRQEAEPGRYECAFLGCLAHWEYCNRAADRGEFWGGHCFHEVLFWKRFTQSCLQGLTHVAKPPDQSFLKCSQQTAHILVTWGFNQNLLWGSWESFKKFPSGVPCKPTKFTTTAPELRTLAKLEP